MVEDPATAGALAASVLGVIGLVRALRHGGSSAADVGGLSRVAETYIRSLGDVALEREQRITIVTVLSALPPGGAVIYQHSNGAKLTIRAPSSMSPRLPKGPWPQSHHHVDP